MVCDNETVRLVGRIPADSVPDNLPRLDIAIVHNFLGHEGPDTFRDVILAFLTHVFL
jgi:hypothetical protein